MSKFDGAVIKIVGWAKYNGRSDIKKCSWLRLENSIAISEGLHGLDAAERFVFIELACIASQKQCETFRVNVQYIADRAKAKPPVVESAISKLIENGTLEHVVPGSVRICTDLDESDGSGPYERTNETNETNEHAGSASAPRFDFESLYRKYPRKEGKTSGLAKCKAQIKTTEDFFNLSVSIDRYASHVAEKQTEPKYIKHFSSFMTSWRDWLDPDTGTAAGAPGLDVFANIRAGA